LRNTLDATNVTGMPRPEQKFQRLLPVAAMVNPDRHIRCPDHRSFRIDGSRCGTMRRPIGQYFHAGTITA
jgi:hypothetical protein